MKEGIAAIRGKGGIVAMIVIMTFAVFCIGFVQILIKPLILAFAGEVELEFSQQSVRWGCWREVLLSVA